MPPREISTEKRVLLAFALSALILLIFAPLQRRLPKDIPFSAQTTRS